MSKEYPEIIWEGIADTGGKNTMYDALFGTGDRLLMFNLSKEEAEKRIRQSLDEAHPTMDAESFTKPVRVATVTYDDQVYMWKNPAKQLKEHFDQFGLGFLFDHEGKS